MFRCAIAVQKETYMSDQGPRDVFLIHKRRGCGRKTAGGSNCFQRASAESTRRKLIASLLGLGTIEVERYL
jgi:hypothetical protein